MADMDYAQHHDERPEWMQEEEKKSSWLPITLAFLIGGGAGFGGHVLLNKEDKIAQKTEQREMTFLQKKLDRQQTKIDQLQKEIKILEEEKNAATNVDELTFYEDLPKQSVTPEPLPVSPVKKATPIAKKTTVTKIVKTINEDALMTPITSKSIQNIRNYRLQVSSYKDISKAHSFEPKLHKLGFRTVIKKIEINNLGTRYRLYANNFSSKAEAQKAKALIKKRLKLDTLIVKSD